MSDTNPGRSESPSDATCVAWGVLEKGEHNHPDCPVTAVLPATADRPERLAVCPCECHTCKRAWWDAGRPVVRDGRIVRAP